MHLTRVWIAIVALFPASFATITAIAAQPKWTRQVTRTVPPENDSRKIFATKWGLAFYSIQKQEVWMLGTDWKRIRPAVVPPSRTGYAISYDPNIGILLYGAGLWVFDGQTWTDRTTAGMPQLRGASLVYDSRRARTVLIGSTQSLVHEMWDLHGQTWTRLQLPAVPPPGPMGYDAARDRIVLVRTVQATGNSCIACETWSFDGQAWARLSPLTSPPLAGFDLTYDAIRERLVLAGGALDHGCPPTLIRKFTSFEDTWEWDGANWQKRSTAKHPALGAATAFWPDGEAVYALGGYDDYFGFNYGPFYKNELWRYQTDTVASITRFGAGCSGSFGTPDLASNTRPWIGDTLRAVVSGVGPSTTAVWMVIGASDRTWGASTLPFDLSAIGLPGCRLFVSPDILVRGIAAANGRATFSATVPASASLAGATTYLQALVPDSPIPLAASNALAAKIGTR